MIEVGQAGISPVNGDPRLRAWFILAVAAGAATIAACTFLDLSTAANVILPSLVMAAYLAVAFRRVHSGLLTREQVGDTFYYLGFLYTLLTIAFSLIKLGGDGTAQLDTASLMARFGVAVLTTFLGMSARLWMVQFRLDEAQAPKLVRENVAQAMSDLAVEVRLGLTQFRQVRTATFGALQEALDSAAKRLTAADETRSRRIEKLFADMGARHEAVLGKLEQRIANLRLEPEELRAGLRQAMDGLEGEISRITASVNTIATAGQGHAGAWQAATRQLSAAAGAMAKVSEQASELASVKAALADVAKAVEGMGGALARFPQDAGSALKEVGETARQVVAGVDGYRQSIAEAARTVEALGGSLKRLPEDLRAGADAQRGMLEEELNRVRGLRVRIEAEVDEAIAVTAKVYAELKTCVDTLSGQMGGAGADPSV